MSRLFYLRIPENFVSYFPNSRPFIYHSSVWRNFDLLHNSLWITFPTQSWLILYSSASLLPRFIASLSLSLYLSINQYIYIYIYIERERERERERESCHLQFRWSSVRLYTRDSRSWDRNPADFYAICRFYGTATRNLA